MDDEVDVIQHQPTAFRVACPAVRIKTPLLERMLGLIEEGLQVGWTVAAGNNAEIRDFGHSAHVANRDVFRLLFVERLRGDVHQIHCVDDDLRYFLRLPAV
jgi:hypothetical protein